MLVKEAMVTDVKTCLRESNLEDVARLMWENDIGCVPVVSEDNRPLGIVTDRDIAMSAMLNHEPLWELEAFQVIQEQQACCCRQDSPLQECIGQMEAHGVRRIIVVRDDGTLAGILSMGDAVAFTHAGMQADGGLDQADLVDMLKHVSAHHMPLQRPGAARH